MKAEIRIFKAGSVDNNLLTYVVMGASFRGKWVFVRHRERSTWEMPAGHIEKNEIPDDAALRELKEETGAGSVRILPLCDYAVRTYTLEYGRFYRAYIENLTGHLMHETEQTALFEDLPGSLTYPEVQTRLFDFLIQNSPPREQELP